MKHPRGKHRKTEIGVYECQSEPLTGTRYADIMPQARRIFRKLQKQTKRRPYIRSAYFKKDKIFFEYFWTHLNEKPLQDRARRLRYLPCALELLKISRQSPITFIKAHTPDVLYHQFEGNTPDRSQFLVVIKQDLSSGKKYLLSVFPCKNKK